MNKELVNPNFYKKTQVIIKKTQQDLSDLNIELANKYELWEKLLAIE